MVGTAKVNYSFCAMLEDSSSLAELNNFFILLAVEEASRILTELIHSVRSAREQKLSNRAKY